MSQVQRQRKINAGRVVGTIRLLFLLVILSGCGKDSNTETSGIKGDISVTYAPQKWIVERLAGDDFKVNVLLPPGSDPETYTPTVAQLRDLNRGGVWLHLNTIGFEQSLLEGIPTNGVRLVDLSEGIQLMEHLCHHHHEDGDEHHSHSEECEHNHTHTHQGSADPHLWSSVRNTETIAANTLSELIRLNPQDSLRYKQNFEKLQKELRMLDREIGQALSKSGAKAFMVRHPSLSYFARDYGLTQIATEAEGKEPSPLELARCFDEAKLKGAKIFVTDPGLAGKQAETLARNGGLKPMALNLNSEEWLKEIRKLKNL